MLKGAQKVPLPLDFKRMGGAEKVCPGLGGGGYTTLRDCSDVKRF